MWKQRIFKEAEYFYGEVLGLDQLMDMDFIATYGSHEKMEPQISFLSEGGSGASVPDLSIEVDNLDDALARVEAAGFRVEYGPAREPWGVCRFLSGIHSEGLSIFCFISERCAKLLFERWTCGIRTREPVL